MLVSKKHSLYLQLLGIAVLVIFTSNCSRSNKFKEDKGYFDGAESNYYKQPPEQPSASEMARYVGQVKKRVVVFDFWNHTPIGNENLGKFAADELRRNLFQSGKVLVSPDIESRFTTKDFTEGDKVKIDQLIREGKRLGVSVVVIGRITKLVFRQSGEEIGVFRQRQSIAAADVEMKIFDIQGNREITAVKRSADAESTATVAFENESLESKEFRLELTRLAIRNTMRLMVPPVVASVQKLQWEGRIAKITGGKVFINAGRASGLMIGDILKVITAGNEIYDPVTGAFLGHAPGELKGTLEIVDFVGNDSAISQTHTGGNFKDGDQVQLY